MLIEVAVASALLVATIVAVGKLSWSARSLQTRSGEALATQLAVENVMDQIQGMSSSDISASVKRWTDDRELTCGCVVTIGTSDASIGESPVVRAIVTAMHPAGTTRKSVRWWAEPQQETSSVEIKADTEREGADNE
ncbi:hypothetical protein [Stieleria varia]|nr:hypothetical protein [Stieleria varia]